MNVTSSIANKDTNDENCIENDSQSDDPKAEILDDGLEDVHLDSDLLVSADEEPKPISLSESPSGKDSEVIQEARTTIEENDVSSSSPIAPLVLFFQFPAQLL